MAKKVVNVLKLQIPAGGANPSPPVGPALGQVGLNIMDFCNAFNSATQESEKGMPLPVVINVYEDKNAIIDVTDNGVGIPLKLKEKIFEPRFTTKSKGMGLGLSIIKNLVTAHSGKITFTSKKGKTTFRVTFPKIDKKI